MNFLLRVYCMVGLLFAQTTMMVSQERVPMNSNWRQSLQQRMDTFKRTMSCAFTKEGCTRAQVAKIGAIVGTILLAISVGVGKWVSLKKQYTQPAKAQEAFLRGMRTNVLFDLIEAVEAGLIVGPKELAGIRAVYDKKMAAARATGNAKKMNSATEYKDDLRQYFEKPEHQDQLIAKRAFWDWIAVYGK